jgi:hypothetical protein
VAGVGRTVILRVWRDRAERELEVLAERQPE